MQFFNFGNVETYHYFKWLTESGAVDTEALVQRALNAVAGDPRSRMGMDMPSVARANLAPILDKMLWDYADRMNSALQAAHIADNTLSLLLPLLDSALSGIDRSAVAEALLIKHGKWNPDTDSPGLSAIPEE